MDRKERKAYLYDKLKELATQLIVSPDEMKKFAERWRGGFRQYSFHNIILIWIQKREATICAGLKQWNKHKRYVNSGEKALWILAPGFKTIDKEDEETGEVKELKTLAYFLAVPVFDISQTNGEPLEIGNTEIRGNAEIDLDKLKDIFKIPVKVSNGIEDGSTDGKTIEISERKDQSQMICAYIHELSHISLDHLDGRKDLNRDLKELEAEATSYIICQCIGIDNEGAKFYINSYRGNKAGIEKSSLKVLTIAEKIVNKIYPKEGLDKAIEEN